MRRRVALRGICWRIRGGWHRCSGVRMMAGVLMAPLGGGRMNLVRIAGSRRRRVTHRGSRVMRIGLWWIVVPRLRSMVLLMTRRTVVSLSSTTSTAVRASTSRQAGSATKSP